MSKLNTGLLILIAALTVVNTYMIFDGQGSGNGLTDKAVKATPVKASQTSKTLAQNKANPIQKKKAQEASKPDLPATSISFPNKVHDFGTIQQDSKNEHVFEFTNTGKEPLVIEKAKGSCGCTVPEYPKEPIPPGQTGEIKVVYKPGKQKNQQNKSVTITANTQPRNTVLNIKANVQPKS